MAKVGRNEPCPCGSGKKYKKCCLAKDEQEEREERQRIEAAASVLHPEADWHIERDTEHAGTAFGPTVAEEEAPESESRQLLNHFFAADYEGRISILLETLESGKMDEELAFEMLIEIWDVAVDQGEQERFRGLVCRLQREAPEAYQANSSYFNRWMLEDALDRGESELVPGLLEPFARDPLRDVDALWAVMDLLMYYGQADPLLEAMATACPSVRSSGQLVHGVADEFVEIGAQLAVLNYLGKGGTPNLEDPRLQAALSPFLPLPDDNLPKLTLAVVSGAQSRSWALTDFLLHATKEPSQDLRERLRLFSLEWLRYLWRERGVPLSKGELARIEMVKYQEQQVDEAQDGLLVLVPRPRELEDHLAALLNFISPQPARAAAMLELLPQYLEFLAQHDLLTTRKERAALQSLRKVHSDTVSLLREHMGILLAPAVEASWPKAA